MYNFEKKKTMDKKIMLRNNPNKDNRNKSDAFIGVLWCI